MLCQQIIETKKLETLQHGLKVIDIPEVVVDFYVYHLVCITRNTLYFQMNFIDWLYACLSFMIDIYCILIF